MTNFYDQHITTDFDHLLEQKNIYYQPWIGKNYSISKKKIIIVGESFYNWGKNESEKEEIDKRTNKQNFVRNLIKEHGFPNTLEYNMKKGKLFINVEKTLLSKNNVEISESEALWESVVYHEFVQRPLSDRSERPNNQDYREGAEYLVSLIDILIPEFILFLGSDHSKVQKVQNLIKGIYYSKDAKIDGRIAKRIEFERNEKSINLIAVGHPSSSFFNYSWNNWSNYLKQHGLFIEQSE